MKNSKSGFTLIELMIVLAIIAIAATLVIANLASSRKAGNETSAIKGCKASIEAMGTMKKLLILDADADGQGEYPTDMTQMQDTSLNLSVPMAAAADATQPYHGYLYSVSNDGGTGEDAGYVFCTPSLAGTTGNREFCSATDGQCYGAVSGTGDPSPYLPGQPAGFVVIQE